MYIDKSDNIVNEYNDTYLNTIKMKTVDVKNDTHIDFSKDVNDENPKFQVDGDVRTSKYKNIFPKRYASNWPEEVFVISKIKNTVPWTYLINDLNGEEIFGHFYEKELQKMNKNLEQKK